MDPTTKSELRDVIEAQKEQIQKYEKKLRDLVHAYKGLLKEKEALEASLKCLSGPAPKQLPPGGDGEGGEDGQVHNDPLHPMAPADSKPHDIHQLQEQIQTLTNSLATMTQEKSEMEASFKADKKQIREMTEEKVSKLEMEKLESQEVGKELQEQVLQLKAKLISQQYEREKEQNDHAVMLRELQKLVAQERMQKELAEHACDDLRSRLFEKENAPDVSVEYERQIQSLQSELESVQNRLKASEEKADLPSPFLLELKKEMVDLKAQHRIQVQLEQKRANEAEERAALVRGQSEERVSSLEAKLSELSEVVGSYERTRLQDQQAIERLKERVTQLDMENTALARAAHSNNEDIGDNDDSNLDIQALVDKVMKLKGLLKLANERSERPIDIEELLKAQTNLDENEEDTHKRCREELLQLKEEFERYKLRAQSVLKNKSAKDSSTTKEVDSVKKHYLELMEQIKALRQQADDEEKEHEAVVKDMRKSITRLQQKHQEDLNNAEVEYKKRAAELEHQLHKHRDRTIALLVEKDKEIEALRMGSPVKLGDELSVRRSMSCDSSSSLEGMLQTEEEAAVSQLVQRLTVTTGCQSNNAIFHFAQEQARKDVEVNKLRKKKHDTESALRDLKQTFSVKEASYLEQIDNLKEEVRKHERNKSRESANLEYLKNVVYHYMICNESLGRQQMLNAIATILQFSPQEKTSVLQQMTSWWGYSPVKGKKPPTVGTYQRP